MTEAANDGADALALHAIRERSDSARWAVSAAIVIGLHAGAIATALALHTPTLPAGVAIPMIMVDMAQASAAPQISTLDLAHGPEMQQADQASPPPVPEQIVAAAPQNEATPPQPAPAVVLRAEQKPAPETRKVEPIQRKPKPTKPINPKPVAMTQRSEQPPAPHTSAAPKAERVAPDPSAASAGARAAAALPSYSALLAAHLQRFKQYPATSRAAGEQGTATLSFVVSRSGQVLSSRLSSSTGYAALDAETLALLRRAQPLPAFPPELTKTSLNFNVPIRFSVR